MKTGCEKGRYMELASDCVISEFGINTAGISAVVLINTLTETK